VNPTMMAAPLPPVHPLGFAPPGVVAFPPSVRRSRGRRVAAAAAIVTVLAAATATAVLLTRSPAPHTAQPPVYSAPPSRPTPGPPASTTPTNTSPGAPAPPVAASALSGFLLPVDQVAAIFGVPSMTISESNNDGLADGSPYVSAKDCSGAYTPGDQTAYANTKYTGVADQYLLDTTGPDGVQQAVIAFQDADAARSAFAGFQKQWAACANRDFTLTLPNETPRTFTFGPLTTPNGALVITATQQHMSYIGSQRVLAVRNNVIIDLGAYGIKVGNKGVDLVNAIAAKIPQ
jgi:serine/threonine-protein kinase